MKLYKRYVVCFKGTPNQIVQGWDHAYLRFNFFQRQTPFQGYKPYVEDATLFRFKWMANFFCRQYNSLSSDVSAAPLYYVLPYPVNQTWPKQDYNLYNCITITEWIKHGNLDFYKKIGYPYQLNIKFNVGQLELQIIGTPADTRLYCEQLNYKHIPYARP